jgi:hypothetical protein
MQFTGEKYFKNYFELKLLPKFANTDTPNTAETLRFSFKTPAGSTSSPYVFSTL